MDLVEKGCIKCSEIDFEIGTFRNSKDFSSPMFDSSQKEFIYVTCKKCGYTEFYKETKQFDWRFVAK